MIVHLSIILEEELLKEIIGKERGMEGPLSRTTFVEELLSDILICQCLETLHLMTSMIDEIDPQTDGGKESVKERHQTEKETDLEEVEAWILILLFSDRLLPQKREGIHNWNSCSVWDFVANVAVL
jgi:hypothetical protein